MMKKTLSFLLCLATYSEISFGTVVNTTSGPVRGHLADTVSPIDEFLGIPFAKPPTGVLRFQPPQKYEGDGEVFDAEHFSVSCPASLPVAYYPLNLSAVPYILGRNAISILNSTPPTGFGEDCLTVNVWAPPHVHGARTKAVLVWIYGGGFTTGSSGMSGSSGKRIAAEQDIVVVSFNYRTNIFGFPRNPAGTQNVGLLDQRLALEWIRDNIANFGGDTKRITIMGQSAGGTSIDYYGFAWTQDPIIAGSIVQSGTSFSFAASSVNESAVSWFNVSGELGCGGSKSNLTEVLSCMQIKDFEDIIAAVQVADAAGLGGSVLGSFGPTIDEEVVFSDYDHRARHGQFIQRPLLIGNNNYEAGFFKIVTALSGARSGISLNPPDFYWEAFQKVAFECATAHRAYYHVQAGLPVWRYRYFGEFPNLALSIVPSSGAYHGSELPMLFDMLGGLGPSTSAQLAIGREMRSAWSAFVRDPEVGLVERPVHWKPYNPEKQSLIRIAFNNATGPNYSDTALYDYICPLLTALAGNDGATSSTFSDGYVDAYAELVELDQQDVERLFQMYQT